MCSGPFKLDSWKTGQGVKVVPSGRTTGTPPAHAAVTSLTFIGVPDDATFTAGMETGAISGAMRLGLTLVQLRTNPNVTVSRAHPTRRRHGHQRDQGPARRSDGTPGVVVRLDRNGIINTVYRGAGSAYRTPWRPQAPGGCSDVVSAGYDALPAMNQDLTKAKALITQAGATGQTITIGTSSGVPLINTETLAFGGRAVDRSQGRAAERQRGELHQLLHRPQGLWFGGCFRNDELRRLRRSGGSLSPRPPSRRVAELQRLVRPGGHRGLERCPQRAGSTTKRAQYVRRRAEDHY